MVYDFRSDMIRPAAPGDRLQNTVQAPFKEFIPEPAAAAALDAFLGAYMQWHLEGGTGLIDQVEGDDDDTPASCRKLLLAVLRSKGFSWLKGQSLQWMACDDKSDEIRGSPDKMLMMLKWLAKMFSRTDKFVGF